MTPYQKIMRAAEQGTDLHLTAEEVKWLALDGPVEAIAMNHDDDDFERRNADKRRADQSSDG